MSRLQGIQYSLNYPHSSFLVKMEQQLINEFKYILKLKKVFWKLKSHITCLNQGDANKKFFHTSTLIKRKKNRILSLRDDNNNWISDQEIILSHTTSFFQNLFKTTYRKSLSIPTIVGATGLSDSDEEIL